MAGIELISKDVLFVLLFLIPGYVGFITLLSFLNQFFPAFRYRIDTVGTFPTIVWSIIWSSVTFLVLFNITSYAQLMNDMNIAQILITIVLSICVAEIISIVIWLIPILILTLIVIKQIFGKNKKPFFEIMWSIYVAKRKYYGFLADKLYLDILLAAQDNNDVRIHLNDQNLIEGKIQKTNDISVLNIKDGQKLITIRLKDIKYVEVIN